MLCCPPPPPPRLQDGDVKGEATRRLTGVRVPIMPAEGTEGEAGAAAAEAETEAPPPPLIRCVGGPARGASPPPPPLLPLPPPVLSISMLDELVDLIDPGRIPALGCCCCCLLCSSVLLLWSRFDLSITAA